MERLDVYKCAICGNVLEVLHVGGGPLTCCGTPMTKLEANTSDGAQEKHLPVFQEGKVQVSSVPHPMVPEHYIEWIDVVSKDSRSVCRRFLEPGESPEALFCGDCLEGASFAREYCNLHGLWKGTK